MYYPNQIVYDLDLKVPVRIGSDIWDPASYPKRSTHFIRHTGKFTREHEFYEIYSPKTIEEAERLLLRNRITPAPIYEDHCWKCCNWVSNCAHFKTCSEWATSLEINRRLDNVQDQETPLRSNPTPHPKGG